MPTNGVTEGRTQIANFSQFIDQFMKLVQSYGGDAAKAFSAVLDGSAPFLSDFQENTSALRNFRESLPGMFKLAPLPDEVTGYLNRYGEGMDRAT
jgi:hypothetical protein